MTTEPQDNSALHHDETLTPFPITLLLQVNDGRPHPIGQDAIFVRGTPNPDGSGITFDGEETGKATVQAITRIISRGLTLGK